MLVVVVSECSGQLSRPLRSAGLRQNALFTLVTMKSPRRRFWNVSRYVAKRL